MEACDKKIETPENNLHMTLQGKRGAISVWKQVIRTMGYPPFVTLKISPQGDSLAFLPCEGKMSMSFSAPSDEELIEGKRFEVKCKKFVNELLRHNGFDFNATYQIKGVYIPENKAVVFKIRDAVLYSEKHDSD